LDALKAYAAGNTYDKIAEFFNSLPDWDGRDRIAELAKCFSHKLPGLPDGSDPIERFLRKWLVGAVARALTGTQNFVLVLMGEGGIGKSYFAKWLAPAPDMFSDDQIDPDSRESAVLAARTLVHELSELGSVTSRADVNALKRFLTAESSNVRLPYARTQSTVRHRESYIGTSNPAADLLRDATGNRRFIVLQVDGLDWGYTNLDKFQIWAQAYALYQAGYDFHLAAEETAYQSATNAKYESVTHSFAADALRSILSVALEYDNRDVWIQIDLRHNSIMPENTGVYVYAGSDGCYIPTAEFASAVAAAYNSRTPERHSEALRALVARVGGENSARIRRAGARIRCSKLTWEQAQKLLDYLD
jgi:predicted P-loop ATPase